MMNWLQRAWNWVFNPVSPKGAYSLQANMRQTPRRGLYEAPRSGPLGTHRAPAITVDSPKSLPAGRVSLDSLSNNIYADKALLPPTDYHSNWRLLDLDTKHLDLWSPMEILDALIDLSPDVSRAAWDFQRLCNPGWECKAYALGSEKTELPEGKAWLDNVWLTLRNLYGSPDVVIGRYYMGAFLRGGFCGEIALDSGRSFADLVAPDPFSIRFRKEKRGARGDVWIPGQMQRGGFVSLDIPTFSYVPVDPAPASPYGRSLAAPALFTSLFILSVLHDVKRVIMQQGYKRMDIKLDTELAMDAYSYDQQGYASFGEYVQGAMDAVREAYRNLQPDDALIHTSIFELGVPAGTIDSDSIGAIANIISILEKRVARGLKSNSLLMDVNSQQSESDSNRRWEITAAGVKSLQHACEHMLEKLLGTGLQADGIQAVVEFRFSELRAAEMFRDEQTMAMRIQNARELHRAGYTSQNESSLYAIKHNADVPEPREGMGSLDFKEDNSSGNENLKQDSDDRLKEIFGSNGHA
jgi:hypothetical protein